MSGKELERWTALKRIHEALIDTQQAERPQRLLELVGDDADLLEDARTLLQSCEDAEKRLPVPDRETVDAWFGMDPSKAPSPRRRFGPFQIVHELAQGGMGIVFEAEQDEPKRRVALKVLRAGLDTESARLRFEHEARVLGNLTHHGIATLYGVGEHQVETGEYVPYLVMELVEGARPITNYVREKQLPLRERLDLFGDVAEAVAAGHQRGIIHRDLKPDNVLVDVDGRTKVIDFGIARVTTPDIDRGQVTKTGLVMGTLGYIAPEQLRRGGAGDDVRMDVYALGVILYEMLTGQRPLKMEGADVLEAVRITLEQRPTPATQHVPDLPGDIVLILNKALAREPEARYLSVEAFAGDVSSFLRNEPIRARSPSWTYQVRLFTRRHWAGVLSTSVILIALTSATWLSLRSASQAREAEFKERVSSERAQSMLLESQSLVQGLVDDLYKELVKIPGTLPVRMALVERLEAGAEALRVRAGDDPRLLHTAATVHHHVANLNFRHTGDHLGRPKAALEANARALSALELLLAAPGETSRERRRDDEMMRAVLLGDRAALYTHEGDADAARKASEACTQQLEALRAAWPMYAPVRNILAGHHLRVARMTLATGDEAAALARVETGLEALPPERPSDPGDVRTLLGHRGYLQALAGRILRHQGRLKEAKERLQSSLDDFLEEQSLDAESPGIRLKLSMAYGELGLLAMTMERFEVAEAHLNDAIRLGEEQVARNPEDRQARESLYVDMDYMAKVKNAKGDPASAVLWQERSNAGGALSVKEQPNALFPRIEQRIGLNLLGGYLMRNGETARGAEVFAEAYDLARQLVQEFPTDGKARLGWAEALDALGIARWASSQGLPPRARRAMLVEAKALFEESADAHRAMAAEGLLPSTHTGVVAQILNKVRICEQQIESLDAEGAEK